MYKKVDSKKYKGGKTLFWEKITKKAACHMYKKGIVAQKMRTIVSKMCNLGKVPFLMYSTILFTTSHC
jgi:hypothetical protein